MLFQLLAGCFISIVNFGIHAVMTGLVVVTTRRIAGRTDDLHVFMRVAALLLVTVVALTVTHILEIAVWAAFMELAGIAAPNLSAFEFAFENYTALGYGDVVAGEGWRLIGPIMALNGLLLIGWSVAIIFEVMRMAELQIGRPAKWTP
jgi:ion channel